VQALHLADATEALCGDRDRLEAMGREGRTPETEFTAETRSRPREEADVVGVDRRQSVV
jgi:hypothetical protein